MRYAEQLTAIWQEGLDSAKSPSVMVWVVTWMEEATSSVMFAAVFIIFSIFFSKIEAQLIEIWFCKDY